MSGFLRRQISVTIGTPTQGANPSEASQVTLNDYRCSVSIVKQGSGGMGHAEIRIWGVDVALMNQVNTLGARFTMANRNEVSISAGDAVNGMALVFQGTILQAWIDFDEMPEVALVIYAYAGLLFGMQPVPPVSYRGSASVATIIGNIARQADPPYQFENNGVTGQLVNPYFPGSPRQQIEACARAAGINWIIDKNTVAIWPKGGTRGGAAPLVSPSTGMIGYPTYTLSGIMVRSVFSPSIDVPGGTIQVQSSQAPANGTWSPFACAYRLEAKVPGGTWEAALQCVQPGYLTLAESV